MASNPKPKTTKVPKLTNTNVGTQAQRDAINKGIANLNKSLAGGISGVKDSKGKTIKEDVYFTKEGAKGGKTGKMYTDAPTPVITAANMKPVPPISLPTPPQADGMFGVSDTINAGLAGTIGGTYDATTKQMTPAPTQVETPPATATGIFQQYLNANAQAYSEMPSSVDMVKQQQKMLRPKENLVNSLAGQLNTITADRDAAMLGLEGQGRGQTSGFIGGEQARISREAAIRAMPIQAQLAIAQDDLESARSYASQLFTAKAQDAQNAYNYRKELNASIYSYLDSQEKMKMAQNEKALDRAFSIEQSNRDTLRQLSMQAIEYGQGALAAEIMGMNPASATFDKEYGSALARLRKPVSGGGDGWELKDVNGVSSWVNKYTQEVKPVEGGGVTPADAKETGTINDIDKILLLTDTQLQESLGKRNIIQRNIPGTVEYQFAVQHDNLMNQLALAARGDLKGQGAVSDYEAKLLKSAQTTLNLYMDPKAYRDEAKQVKGAIQTSSGIPAYVEVKSADGKETRYAVLNSQQIQEAVNQGYVIKYQ